MCSHRKVNDSLITHVQRKMTTESSDLLTCKICQLPYNEPKRLPCLHTFCRACLVYQCKLNAVTTSDDGMICLFCPLCKQLYEVPSRTGIDSLPDHYLLRSLLASIESRTPRPCDHCRTQPRDSSLLVPSGGTGETGASALNDDRKLTGVGAGVSGSGPQTSEQTLSSHCCIKCEEFLCETCVQQHKKNRSSADHLIVCIKSMKELCQIIAVRQLQKPSVVATLVNKFDNNSSRCVVDEKAPDRQLQSSTGIHAQKVRPSERKVAAAGRTFDNPIGMALNKSDELVVSNDNNGTICVVNLEGECLRRIDKSEHLAESGEDITVHETHKRPLRQRIGCCAVTAEGFIAIAMSGDVTSETGNGTTARRHRVGVIESLVGRQVASLDVIETDKNSSTSGHPYGIAVTEDGHVIVSDIARNCIMVFDADFRCVKRFGRRGSRSCQFKSPRFLAVTPRNEIVVSDSGNHTVKVFTLNGDFRFKFGRVGHDPGRLLHPAGVCTDRYGNIFVADRDNHRVQMFSDSGRFVGVVVSEAGDVSSGGLDIRPLCVAVTSRTRLVVLMTGIEGVDWVEVRVYEVRCSLPPPEVRSVQQIIANIRTLRNDPSISGALDKANRRRTGNVSKLRMALPDLLMGDRNRETEVDPPHGVKSQVCVIS